MKKKPVYDYPVVSVLWNDACSVDDWLDRKTAEAHTTSPTITVWHLLAKNKKQVIVASTAASTGEVASTTIIPKGMIVKMVMLSRTKFYRAS